MLQVHIVVVDELHGHGDQRDVAREAAVVEPVDADRGNAIDLAGRIHGDDDEVAARMKRGGHFAVEGSEAALVVADALLVDPDEGLIVGRADVEEGARVGLGLKVEVALIPDDSLVAEERRVLGVPVAGHLERGRGGEVVLRVVRAAIDVGVSIEGVGLVVDLAVGGVERSRRWLIDQVVPVSVERGDRAMIDADQKRLQRLLLRQHRQREDAARE